MPAYAVGWEVLFYCHFHLKAQIAAYIGYAEAAFAEDASDEIAAHQDGSWRHVVWRGRISALRQAADRAGFSGLDPAHTVWAKFVGRRDGTAGVFPHHRNSPPLNSKCHCLIIQQGGV